MSKKGIKICCTVTGILIILLVAILVILYYTVFKPTTPEIVTSLVNVEYVDFRLLPLAFNLTLGVEIVVKNRNFAGFEYGGSTTTVSYHGNYVGFAPMEAGMIHARRTETIHTSVQILASKVAASRFFPFDLASGGLNFTSSSSFGGKVIIVGLFKLHGWAEAVCYVRVQIFSGSRTSTCDSAFTISK
ncbi:uncharacterized protein [Typha latifolia]|uniref:uncharacterized protein n=1 Tax=Typha latifolia TaxID=4733 RepID=UPI003C2EBEF8